MELLSAFGQDAKMDLMYMKRKAILKALENYDEDTKVIIGRRDVDSKALAGYFFPGVSGEPSIFGERKEG